MKQKNEWGEYLATFKWEYYTTFSTPYRLTQPSARRAIQRFYSSCKSMFPNSIIFFASEPFDLKEGCHVHCLINLNDHLNSDYIKRKFINQTWQKVTGTSNINGKGARVHLEKYIKKLGGNNYVSKYINRPDADYELLID